MFFLFPVGVDYRAHRYPVVTFTLIGINVAVFVVTFLAGLNGTTGRQWELENLWLIPAQTTWHSYLTSAFVHAGLFHLAGNMVYLFLFGACVEDIIGWWRFVVFYLVGILSAGFLHVLLTPDGPAAGIPMGGASGAVSACIGGFLLVLARTRVELKWVFFLFFRVWSGEWYIKAWVLISLWFLSDLLGLVSDLGEGAQGGGVAFAAHVGGTIGGLAMMALCKKWIKIGVEDADDAPSAARLKPVAVVVEAPARTYIFVNGQQMGPYQRSQVTRMVALGSLAEDAQYWEEGMPEWRPVFELTC
jgi:membrane associated rhomboid family serine protease